MRSFFAQCILLYRARIEQERHADDDFTEYIHTFFISNLPSALYISFQGCQGYALIANAL